MDEKQYNDFQKLRSEIKKIHDEICNIIGFFDVNINIDSAIYLIGQHEKESRKLAKALNIMRNMLLTEYYRRKGM